MFTDFLQSFSEIQTLFKTLKTNVKSKMYLLGSNINSGQAFQESYKNDALAFFEDDFFQPPWYHLQPIPWKCLSQISFGACLVFFKVSQCKPSTAHELHNKTFNSAFVAQFLCSYSVDLQFLTLKCFVSLKLFQRVLENKQKHYFPI